MKKLLFVTFVVTFFCLIVGASAQKNSTPSMGTIVYMKGTAHVYVENNTLFIYFNKKDCSKMRGTYEISNNARKVISKGKFKNKKLGVPISYAEGVYSLYAKHTRGDEKYKIIVQNRVLKGGDEECSVRDEVLKNFLAENLKYPQEAKDNKLEGKVFLSFFIKDDGTIDRDKIRVLNKKKIGGGCEEEALRVAKLIPDGLLERVKENDPNVIFPIFFSLK